MKKKILLALMLISLISALCYIINDMSDKEDHYHPRTDIEKGYPVLENIDFRRKIGIIGHWEFIPDVVVCINSPTTRERVDEAILWWSSLGYEFGKVVYDVEGGPCIGDREFGKIIISLITQEHWDLDHLGKTLVTYHRTTGEIFKATILLHNNVPDRVLEHEMGHALGWGHYNRTGHMMHESWSLGGRKSEELKKNP